MLYVVLALTLVVLPFSLYYFDEHQVNDKSCFAAAGCALIQIFITIAIIVALSLALYFTVGNAVVDVNVFTEATITADGTALTSADDIFASGLTTTYEFT